MNSKLKTLIYLMVSGAVFLCAAVSYAVFGPPQSLSHEEEGGPSYVSGSVLAKLKPSISLGQAAQSKVSFSQNAPGLNRLFETKPYLSEATVRPVFRAVKNQGHGLDRVMEFKFDAAEDVLSVCEEIIATGEVEYCQPNYIMSASALPNDTYVDPDQNGTWATGAWGQTFEDMWGLKMVQAVEAWDATALDPGHKGDGVIVAVVDSGLNVGHPDVPVNLFVNTLEDINGNGQLDAFDQGSGGDYDGIDNDGNGIIDDVTGYDFTTCRQFNTSGNCTTTKVRDPVVNDGYGHGTHVTGSLAAATDNGIGTAGVAPAVIVLPVKGLNSLQGQGTIADLAAAIVYAADLGAQVINNKFY